MKKLLGAALCAALIYPTGPASAELLKNLKVGGQVDLQAVSANNALDFNTQANDQIGDMQTRVLLNADWDLLDDVHSKVTLRKNDRVWGQSSQRVLDGFDAGAINNMFVDQANLKIDKMVGNVDATLGRQFYGNPRDLVVYFGPKDNLYGLGVTALDAARFDWSTNMFGLTGLVGKVVSHGISTLASPSDTGVGTVKDLRGLNYACKMTGINAYLYNQVTHMSAAGGTTGAAKNDNLYVLGARGSYMFGNAWVKGEFDKNFGEDRLIAPTGNYTGWAFLASLGYKAELGGFGGVSPWGEFGLGSGGSSANRVFTPIAGDYRPGGIYGLFAPNASVALNGSGALGTVSSNSLGDRAIWGIGVKTTPAMMSKLTAGLSYWDYRYQNAAIGASGTPAAAAGNKHIGSEIDLDATWAHSDNVSLGVGLGTFQTGGAINNAQAAHSPAMLARANVQVKF